MQGQIADLQAVKPVTGLCTIASIDSSTEITTTCMASTLRTPSIYGYIIMRHASRLATVIQQLTLASYMVYFMHHFSKQRIIPEASTLTVYIIIGLLDKPRGAHGGMHQINCTHLYRFDEKTEPVQTALRCKL